MSSKQGIRLGWTGSRPKGSLALDLTEESVVLYDLATSGAPLMIAEARLDSSDFMAEIDALRIEALIRDPAKAPVTIWLPEAQILSRSYVLASRGHGAARAEALRNLQAETGYASEELAIDLMPGKAGQPSIVLAALCQTVREAIEYTERWGFVPGAVSTRVHSDAFASRAPAFTLPTTRAATAGMRFAQIAAACVVALGCGFAGLKLYEVSQPILHAITVNTVPGHLAGSTENRDQGATFQRTSRTVARSTTLQSLPLQRIGVSDYDRLKLSGVALYGQARRTSQAKQPIAPGNSVAMRIGAISGRPIHIRPGRLAPAPQSMSAIQIAALRDAIDRIRIGARALARPQKPKRIRTEIAGADADPTGETNASASVMLVSVSETPAPRARAAARNIQGVNPNASASLVPKQRSEAPGKEADGPGKEAVEQTLPEPANVSVPLPRPAGIAAVADESSTVAATSVEVPPEPSDASSEKPIVSAAPTTDRLDQAEPDPEEVYAALSSPRPLKRPETLRAPEATLPRKTKSKPISDRASPTSVRAAARERGIELGQTNLIGVLEASSGRRALVRLPGGDFRKVARGDDLNGWRVSSIGRQDMRLTRQGQNRTLLLVSR